MIRRTEDQIIMDWWASVSVDGRIPRGGRLSCYLELFQNFKDEGYLRDDILLSHKNNVISRSVNENYKLKRNLKLWKESAVRDLETAESEVFGQIKEVPIVIIEKAVSIEKEKKEAKKILVEAEELENRDYRLFVPNKDSGEKEFTMDYIKENYVFEELTMDTLDSILGVKK